MRAGVRQLLAPAPQPTGLPPRAARLLADPPGFERAILAAVYAAITRFFVQNLAP